jgi:heme/copper-type cytochrome/quinol oxidase subunit 2
MTTANLPRLAALLAIGVLGWLAAGSTMARLPAQEQAPGHRDFTIVAKEFQFSPNRVVVDQNDLVSVTVRSEDRAYGFAIDQYRIVRRVPPGGSTTIEFRADQQGTFRFYSNLTSEPGHERMQGELVVRAK